MSVVVAGRGRWRRSWTKWLSGAALALACSAVARSGHAADAAPTRPVAIGFSNLISRLDQDQIGFTGAAAAGYRVLLLEALRDAGFNAVGAESLVFDKDEADRADVVLGGIVKELSCRPWQRGQRCSVGIEWQLLDRDRDEVVYRVLTRYAGLELPRDNAAAAGRELALGALRSLMSRARFKKLASARRATAPEDADYPSATFAACSATARELPGDFEAIAAGTVIIKTASGTGSGFILSADDLILTAAHVVTDGQPSVVTRAGSELPARIVRISRKHDVALLSLGPLAKPLPCLGLEAAAQVPGADVYAIGSPGGEVLSFSLSRGIVSAVRTFEDEALIQTDAPISPGNSGGPLVDHAGRVVGVVSRKIAAHAVEGIGFAIPIPAALAALGLTPAVATTPSLRQPPVDAAQRPAEEVVVDTPDAPISLDPEGDRKRALEADYARRLQDQKNRTPRYVMPLRWGGLGVGAVSLFGALYTGIQSKDTLTRGDYETLRLKNDLFWAAAVVGFGAFTASYVLEPEMKPSALGQAPRFRVAAGPTSVELNVTFR